MYNYNIYSMAKPIKYFTHDITEKYDFTNNAKHFNKKMIEGLNYIAKRKKIMIIFMEKLEKYMK